MTRWILLRGLTREAAHWGELPQALARRLGPGHQVQTLDLPGNGSLHREPSPATVAQMVEACRRQLPAGEPCVLVAMSLGAMVAIEWSRIAPQEVSSCMLINTSGGGGSTPFWQRLQPRNYLPLLGLLRPGLPPSARECRVLALTSAAPAHHAHVLPYWARIATQRPVSSCNALRQLMAAARYAAPATRPQVPMLLIASAGDRLVSPRCSQDLAQ